MEMDYDSYNVLRESGNRECSPSLEIKVMVFWLRQEAQEVTLCVCLSVCVCVSVRARTPKLLGRFQ